MESEILYSASFVVFLLGAGQMNLTLVSSRQDKIASVDSLLFKR
jgi:hypothetical protein